MRVLSGSARGVPLKTVPDFGTRPILDRLKKSLFSILDSMNLIRDARVADFYAGAGTLGIEALSRGAERCLFVEKRPDAVKLLQENLAKTKLTAKAEVHCATVSSLLYALTASEPNRQRFDLILYDPPFAFSYEAQSRPALETEIALAGQLLYPGHARLILRCEKKTSLPKPANLNMTRHWTDGQHALAFYQSVQDDQAHASSSSNDY